MDRHYLFGVRIVLIAVVAASLGAMFIPPPVATSAARDLSRNPRLLGKFQVVERSNKRVSDADLADRVWIAGFVFTHCRQTCPRIAASMSTLQSALKDEKSGVKLVCITVDPERDTPEVLSKFAKTYRADPDRWWFFTGDKQGVLNLVRDRFKLGLEPASPEDQASGAEEIMHDPHLALVDRGNKVVGYYNSGEDAEMAELITRALKLDAKPVWVNRLPGLNALLNGSCACLLLFGWFFIRAKKIRPHAAYIIAGIVVSALFLTSYLIYHYFVGSVPFRGEGPPRFAYFTILISHTFLAVAVLPFIFTTVLRAARGQFDKHARIARVTFPIWFYVSITGVVIYLMLYQLEFNALTP
ncbi:MAG: hypothetical protein NVSMB14_01260 [Isosphaeraceae bacterium]